MKYFCTLYRLKLKTFHSFVRFNSTIYALSSGTGKSGVAVIRVSGSSSKDVFANMTSSKVSPQPRMATLKTVLDPETKEPLDKGMLLWFPGPRSFTGEDMCELQVHGSKAVIHAILNALSKMKDFRPAEPGEFTKRAFFAGKFDLTEVEGISDLIDAETEMQRKQALFQMEGSLREIYLGWRNSLIRSLAHVEAYIDFSEEENIEDNILSVVQRDVIDLRASVQEHLNDFRKGEILRDGVKTVIIGSPNVGKSSLLNALCRRPAAIVTEVPGTTRDVVESTVNINGYPVLLADTAGIRQSGAEDIVEKEGIRRSLIEANNADLLLLLVDISKVFEDKTMARVQFSTFFSSYCAKYQEVLGVGQIMSSTRHIVIINKLDVLNGEQRRLVEGVAATRNDVVLISCKTEQGLPQLLNVMAGHFQQLCGMPDKKNPACSRARHRYHLVECSKYLDQFLEVLNSKNCEENIVFGAEDLRTATEHLGFITGAVATDEVLEIIFKNFCIGK